MKSFVAFFKKELLQSARGGKLWILIGIFLLFGIMNPAIAKLTPWLMEMMAEELTLSGMSVTAVSADAPASWAQFFKNIPMALIAFVFIYSNIFTKEYSSGTLILVLTKGLSRYKVVIAKSVLMLLLWSMGYWLSFGVTYVCNDVLWDNSIAANLMPAVVHQWLFGVFVIALIVLFSAISSNYIGVLMGTGGCVFALYLAGLVPKIAKYLPTSLMSSAAYVGVASAEKYTAAAVITAVCSVAFIAVSVPIFNKKQL